SRRMDFVANRKIAELEISTYRTLRKLRCRGVARRLHVVEGHGDLGTRERVVEVVRPRDDVRADRSIANFDSGRRLIVRSIQVDIARRGDGKSAGDERRYTEI